MDQRGVIADLDGTIWDSLPYYAAILATETGTNAATHLNALRAGASIVTLVNRAPGIGRTGFGHALASRIAGLVIYPTVTETLSTARARRLRLGVLTSLPGWIAGPLLDATGLRAAFDGVVHASNSRTRKPSKAALEEATRRIGLTSPSEIVYVGDRTIDAETARAADATFAWATYGYGTAPPAGAYTPLRHFAEVLDV